MQFTVAIVALFAGVALSAPVIEERQVPYIPCSGLYASSQCCATDVLGIANLDCGTPPSAPASADEFSAVCSAIGQRARCCVLPLVSGVQKMPKLPTHTIANVVR
ncbi:Fungal hydrophobin [Colletotrichum higginsianum IMI 349063]|uniref:Fungal hydrophobin n=1 Tax=Colletotrichum higginsianum (strain IMI 349063) TaxID=759273 RepID=A0A1B7YSC2_COLHI|nr:Fungal hydrophobin [Colletotrichum higginsianum IMI 349063]OBR14937.1 Fungal hydrophobin [Colletotrichum higginsianum IMI 349063]GJC92786.1 fungal hydrophobin [Colletotrichum higginsianum]